MGYFSRGIHPESLRIAIQVMTRKIEPEDFPKGKLYNEKLKKEIPIKILEEAIRIVKFLKNFPS